MVAPTVAPTRRKLCGPMIETSYLKVLAKVFEVNGERWRPFATQKNGERDEAGARRKQCRIAVTGQSSRPEIKGKGSRRMP